MAGAQNHQPGTEGAYVDRRNASYQAYLEWMPIRTATSLTASGVQLHRTFRFGTLAELTMLDLRQYRDQQPTVYVGGSGSGAATDPTRTMLGAAEQTWFDGVLDTTGAQWRLIGNSVQFMQVDYPPTGSFLATGGGSERNVDAWDGYVTNRIGVQQKIAQHLADYDVVFLTGDIHSSWAADLPLFTGGAVTAGYTSLATEFVCPSVTSDGFKEVLAGLGLSSQLPLLLGATLSINPHLEYLDGVHHGCCVMQATPSGVQADYVYTTSSLGGDERWDPNPTFVVGGKYRTLAGSKQVTAAPTAIVDACSTTPPAEVPEVPWSVALPLSATVTVGAVAAAVAFRQRRIDEVAAIS